jgi:hypothetical protein
MTKGTDTIIARRLAVSHRGNVVEVVTRLGARQERRVVHDTSAAGDRRARKSAARAWILERTQPDVRMLVHVSATGVIHRFSGTITIRADE